MIAVVSAYVPIEGHPRSEAEYDRLGRKLMAIDHPVLFAKGDLDHCWLEHMVQDHPGEVVHAVADNPKKNTLAYHVVQAQKTEWLDVVSTICPADVLVWIDYGIFHIPGVTKEIIDRFLDRAESEQAIAIPGCWEKGYRYDDNWPCWRFAGGVMVVPRRFAAAFNAAMKQEYARWLCKTGRVSWEVNVLSRLEKRDPEFPVWWYGPCGHDSTIFTHYRGTEHGNSRLAS